MIYLLRHGETVWNREGRAQGRGDSPLTAHGEAQALAYAATLRRDLDGQAARLVSSPLGRARTTAMLIAGALGLPPETIELEPRLQEYDFGRWDGLTIAEVERDHAADWARYRAERWHFAAPGGECYAEVAARVGAWLAGIDAAQPVVAVSHGVVGRVLRGLYAGLSQAAILALPEPQDRIFRLAHGRIEELPVAA